MSAAVIALAGSPNSGKSCLFNAITGMRQKVANYPGVTVERKFAEISTQLGTKLRIIDLPGTYSLNAMSLDEQVAVDILSGRNSRARASLNIAQGERPDLIVTVVDATNLERALGFVLEVQALGLPMIIALNMMDIAQNRGLKLNISKLSLALGGIPIVKTIAPKKLGVNELLSSIDQHLAQAVKKQTVEVLEPVKISLEERFEKVRTILDRVMEEIPSQDQWSRRIDQVLLHPIYGIFFLAISLILMFQAVFTWATPLQDMIKALVSSTAAYVGTVAPAGFVKDLLCDGIIAGVGAVIVFIPQILILFLFINVLEGSGYMARAAFILDQMMRKIGLQGRSFVPLLSSFACAIPGILATRTIRHEKDRLLTILISPLMACSARLPVYTLLISAFIPNNPVFVGLKLQGLVMFGLFLFGIVAAVVVAWSVKQTSSFRGDGFFMMELPSYKWPSPSYVISSVYQRLLAFLKRAGTLILGISILLWLSVTFPRPPADHQGPAINASFAGKIGHFLEPVVAPIGFDWRIATGLVPGFAAREVMVSALATVFAVEAENDEAKAASLQEVISKTWPISTGLALLAWYIFAPQCVSTLVTVKRETNSYKWAAFVLVYMLALAYGAAWVTNKIAIWALL